ncbi:uncharacterized protein EDB91DRAFT_1334624 [Suillus paluster]|uniref:uncharacterized protein n=1 Tax=Suillus paluster TaxID=48578 RepID=UPI001B884227|nr:uncharacterized protein EDB91DRAFT_1334624 [Suillus paluster]KAG1748409.1 hypothetical protein EDB91DRAFT_1334624 [Suillus paluster]
MSDVPTFSSESKIKLSIEGPTDPISVQLMRFIVLAVVTALTAPMSVSAISAGTCNALTWDKPCDLPVLRRPGNLEWRRPLTVARSSHVARSVAGLLPLENFTRHSGQISHLITERRLQCTHYKAAQPMLNSHFGGIAISRRWQTYLRSLSSEMETKLDIEATKFQPFAAEVRFGPVLRPLNANPEPDPWSGSGKEGERWTGPL